MTGVMYRDISPELDFAPQNYSGSIPEDHADHFPRERSQSFASRADTPVARSTRPTSSSRGLSPSRIASVRDTKCFSGGALLGARSPRNPIASASLHRVVA